MTPQRRKEVAAGALVLLAIFSVYYFEFMPSAQSSSGYRADGSQIHADCGG